MVASHLNIQQTNGTIKLAIKMIIHAARDIVKGEAPVRCLSELPLDAQQAVIRIKQLQYQYQRLVNNHKRKKIQDQIDVLIEKHQINCVDQYPSIWQIVKRQVLQARKESAIRWINATYQAELSFHECVEILNLDMMATTGVPIPEERLREEILRDPEKMVRILFHIHESVAVSPFLGPSNVDKDNVKQTQSPPDVFPFLMSEQQEFAAYN